MNQGMWEKVVTAYCNLLLQHSLGRARKAIKKFSQNRQFVVITHSFTTTVEILPNRNHNAHLTKRWLNCKL